MSDAKVFSVTVSRINEGLRDSPEVTVQATSLRLTPAGDLYIEGDGNSRMFGATLWESFEVKRVR
jgi:hypothetical protein